MNYSNAAIGKPPNGGIEIVEFVASNLNIAKIPLIWDDLAKKDKKWLHSELRFIKACKYRCLDGIRFVYEHYTVSRMNAWLDYAYAIYNVMPEDLPKPPKKRRKTKFKRNEARFKIH